MLTSGLTYVVYVCLAHANMVALQRLYPLNIKSVSLFAKLAQRCTTEQPNTTVRLSGRAALYEQMSSHISNHHDIIIFVF